MVDKIKEALIEETKGIPKSNISDFLDKMNVTFSGMLSLDLLTAEEYEEVLRFLYDIDWHKQITYYDDCF